LAGKVPSGGPEIIIKFLEQVRGHLKPTLHKTKFLTGIKPRAHIYSHELAPHVIDIVRVGVELENCRNCRTYVSELFGEGTCFQYSLRLVMP